MLRITRIRVPLSLQQGISFDIHGDCGFISHKISNVGESLIYPHQKVFFPHPFQSRYFQPSAENTPLLIIDQ
jgi:hypothetical protein